MHGIINKEDDVSAKNEILNDENIIGSELIEGEHKSYVLPVTKKDPEDVPQQFVEIKKEMDDRDVTMELVGMNQHVVVKEENIKTDLLKKISVKKEQNLINELVKVCKSEEGVITDCTGIQNEIMERIKMKKENRNLVEGLFSEYKSNTVSIKDDVDTEYVDNKSEIVKLIDVKKEENNFVKELVSEYHQSKVVTNKKEADSKENRQVDVRKSIIVDPRKEMLRHAGDGKQLVQNMITKYTVNKSILKPKTYSHVHPSDMRNRIVGDRQTVMGNNVRDEGNTVLKDVIKINLNAIISKEIEKQFLEDRDVQRGETGVIKQGLIKPIEIDSILRKSVLTFGDVETQTAASAAEVVMDREEKSSSVSRGQTNTVTEPVECVTLLDSDDEDIMSEMDESSAKQNTTSNAMDIEFVDCNEEETGENNGGAHFAALQPIGTSSQLACKEQVLAEMGRGLTAGDSLPFPSPPPVLSIRYTNDYKPPVSYPNLIRLAITSSPINKMTVSEIYHFVSQKYPYFRSANIGWKNIIRHTLSQSKWFMRVAGPDHFLLKRGYWAMDYTNYKGLPRRR